MDEYRVLVVTPSGVDVGLLEASLSGVVPAISVRSVAAFDEVPRVLTTEVVHCLLLPSDVDGVDSVRLCHGIRGLFPDLPIVIAGRPGTSVPEDLAVTVVDAESVTGDAVASAVQSALAGGVDADAARPPSGMETLFLSMLDQFPVDLYAKDEEGRHVITSEGLESPGTVLGMTDLEFQGLPEEFREPSYRDDMSIIEGEQTRIDVEGYVDFTESYTRSMKVPWFDEDGDVTGLAGISWDVTERKEREQASRRQLELLVKVALVAAHELRNELQIASGRLELLDDDSEHVEVIADSHRRLSRIVDKVIDLASEEQPRHQPEAVWLSMVGREVWGSIDAGDATLNVRDDVEFVADQESTSLLFQILFRNAIEHGGTDVTIDIGTVDGGFYVADDGNGIDVEPPERVFDAGFTTDPENTGFGLYVARSIATEHDWSLQIGESGDGGARFDVVGPTLEDADPTSRDEGDSDE